MTMHPSFKQVVAKMSNAEEEYVKLSAKKNAEIVENFARAYLAETGLKPSEVVMVSTMEGTSWSAYFRPKTEKERQMECSLSREK